MHIKWARPGDRMNTVQNKACRNDRTLENSDALRESYGAVRSACLIERVLIGFKWMGSNARRFGVSFRLNIHRTFVTYNCEIGI